MSLFDRIEHVRRKRMVGGKGGEDIVDASRMRERLLEGSRKKADLRPLREGGPTLHDAIREQYRLWNLIWCKGR